MPASPSVTTLASRGLLTSRANLVAVITNGTAVLGLGNIGPLAGKPVMEGKGCLFKKFAGIDVFDIEIDATDPDKIVDIVAALEPTFGGINLEDIKAPECFIVERKLRERMKIPVFHDDQHGTAIIVVGGDPERAEARRQGHQQGQGCGFAALAPPRSPVSICWSALGLQRENIFVADIKGVVYKGRKEEMDRKRRVMRSETKARTLAEIRPGRRHIPRPVRRRRAQARDDQDMARNPLILALANPEPEIRPELALRGPPGCDPVHGPVRLSEPGQQRPVLSLHFSGRARCRCDHDQRGDEDCRRARHRRAGAGRGIRHRRQRLWRAVLGFGRDYLIPRPFDPRLIERVAPAVAKAAMDSGVATRPLARLARLTASSSHASSITPATA